MRPCDANTDAAPGYWPQVGLAAIALGYSVAVKGGSAPPAGAYPIASIGVAGHNESRAASGTETPRGGIDSSAILPTNRPTAWSPEMIVMGGIPIRSRGGELDDTAQIQAAINRLPDGQVVHLEAGTSIINSDNFPAINNGITSHGAGPGRTTSAKINGAKPFHKTVSPNPSPLIIVGPSRFSTTSDWRRSWLHEPDRRCRQGRIYGDGSDRGWVALVGRTTHKVADQTHSRRRPAPGRTHRRTKQIASVSASTMPRISTSAQI